MEFVLDVIFYLIFFPSCVVTIYNFSFFFLAALMTFLFIAFGLCIINFLVVNIFIEYGEMVQREVFIST